MKMCIVATRGDHTSLVNLLSTVMAGAVSEMSVRVFLRDEAASMVTRERILRPVLSPLLARDPDISARLEAAGLCDLPAFFRKARAMGDVRFMACSSSLAIAGILPEELIDEIDEVRGFTSFLLEEISGGDILLSF
ncbi:MAG: DsrE family protein [Nitrospiraceae bacterium]|nr:DsrE family protein [Nitrospiraceae bacterium]